MFKLYSGCVEDRNDPLKMGRCKVRIVGLHTESRVTLPTDDLPWAYPISPINSAGTSGIGSAPLGPVEGTWVLITFMDPHEQMPMMLGTMLGAFQTPDSQATGQFTTNTPDAAGNIDQSGSPTVEQNPDGTPHDASRASSSYGGGTAVKDGKVITDKNAIVGPLAKLIAKAESGADGYNAYNKGTVNGKIIPATGKLDLTKMSIKEIMARQALSKNDPDRLFAVGKYQCIPDTLKSACKSLNIDVNQPFNEVTQDIICQEFLVGKKRPALMAYYRSPNKNDEKLLMDAGQSLAAEFASIEDPYYLGYPYKGPTGTYYTSGNKVGTKWTQIKSMLLQEWDFRNNKANPPPTSSIANNDKNEKGADYGGVAKKTAKDTSVATAPKSKGSSNEQQASAMSVSIGAAATPLTLSNLSSVSSGGELSGLSTATSASVQPANLNVQTINKITSQLPPTLKTDAVKSLSSGLSLADYNKLTNNTSQAAAQRNIANSKFNTGTPFGASGKGVTSIAGISQIATAAGLGSIGGVSTSSVLGILNAAQQKNKAAQAGAIVGALGGRNLGSLAQAALTKGSNKAVLAQAAAGTLLGPEAAATVGLVAGIKGMAKNKTALAAYGVGVLTGNQQLGAQLTNAVGAAKALTGFGSGKITVNGVVGAIAVAKSIQNILSSNSIPSLSSLMSRAGISMEDIELSKFGGSLAAATSKLGITSTTGSSTELANNLGLPETASEAEIKQEVAKMAGSSEGQALALKTKLDEEGEPSKPKIAPIGEKNPDGSISNGTGVDPTRGFQDPSGVYPKYKDEVDTNRLATGNNLGRTIVLGKEASRTTGVKIANGGTWDQPPIPYNATYPFNKVTETESGHVEEWDDTKGSERIHWYHKAGTFTEIDHNGTQVNKIVGDGVTIIERNGNVYIKGGYSVTAVGSLNLRTDAVLNIEASGAANIKVFSDAHIEVSGDCNLAVGATLNAHANAINLESDGAFNIRSGSGLNIYAQKDINIKGMSSINTQAGANITTKALGSIHSQADGDDDRKAGGKYSVQSGEDMSMKSGAAVKVQGAADVSMKSDGSVKVQGAADVSMKAGGNFAADGSQVHLNSKMAGAAPEATDVENVEKVKEAKHAEIELPVETRGSSGIDRLPEMPVTQRGSEVGFDSPSAGNHNTYQQYRVATNTSSKTEIGADGYAIQHEKPNSKSGKDSALPAGYDAIMKMVPDHFTAGMQISKYFKLGDLTANGTRIPRVTYDIDGQKITPQQIVANLSNLATNVLDPIREKYGKFVITSAFRRPPFGAMPGDLGPGHKEGGDHPRGCAADIVFTASKQETFNMCKEIVKILPVWNQVIMEYNGSQFWIHVACKPSNNKGDMFTMVSHKTFQGTYPQGGFILV